MTGMKNLVEKLARNLQHRNCATHDGLTDGQMDRPTDWPASHDRLCKSVCYSYGPNTKDL